MSELKEGYYWVKYYDDWEIAKLEKHCGTDDWYINKDPRSQPFSEFQEIGMYLGTGPKQTKLSEDWVKVVNDAIDVPDDLMQLYNKLAFQLRFHTISGKGEVETLASMTRIAEEFFYKKYVAE